MANVLVSAAQPKHRADFVVMVAGRYFQQGDEDPDTPKEWETRATLEEAIHQADYWLRSWDTSHTTIEQPEVWVEDKDSKRVYEPWFERRRVRTREGRILIETPVQFWHAMLAAVRAHRDAAISFEEPMPMGHRMFEDPAACGAEMLASVYNSALSGD